MVEKNGPTVKILLTGATGQLGKSFQEEIRWHNHTLIAVSHSDLDISNYGQVESILRYESPEYVVNAAAFTNVPNAERNFNEVLKANVYGPANLAQITEKLGMKLVHLSTNFVFEGLENSFEDVNAIANPINFYGKSKHVGEQVVTAFNLKGSFIVRTSSIFSEYENNFLCKILDKLERSAEEITVVNDQYCQPTYARDLARQIIYLIQDGHDPGIYHFVNDGKSSWFEFAQFIAKISGHDEKRIVPVSSRVFNDGVRRPISALLKPTIFNSLDPISREWTSALADCLQRMRK